MTNLLKIIDVIIAILIISFITFVVVCASILINISKFKDEEDDKK